MATTDSSDLAGTLLEEYAALEFILLGDLRDLLEEAADHLTRKWLRAVLDALLDTLPRRFDLQEQGGYLAEVLEHYPSWHAQVEALRHEQRSLYCKLGDLRGRIVDEVPFAELSDELSTDLRDWMQSLTAYRRHERRMVQTAFNLEVGCGD